ncbi:hypothetical protein ABEX41_12930 [Bacillus tropicus]|uniref:Uncharacterized protein n=1 Tax=Bacillus tropicus TaxID=2026188 RepID=A0A5C5A6W4_9BACI|nr:MULTISPECIES: hypothetical protein [Bacillus]EEM21341.1 hypothetical protein bthur0001_34970 [Bacillus thuringiensis serovar tochigiensis BGSC 4Y1]ALL23637.1 hypothetical protein BTXL6_20285 [Bacillus thuringiensis]EPF11812.1 hypothetical protein ICA_02274 [Bacillus cereus BAG1O-3]MDR4414756.1 hypothetical protein [Bacillus thuringiensis]PFG82219.1 hypothetical protein DL97_1844 [Bacillus sp. YF23]
MRIIHGFINEDGSLVSYGDSDNGHIDITRIDTGLYEVNFEPHFSNIPSVVATQLWEGSGPKGGSTLDNVVMVTLSNNSVRFKTGGGSGDAANRKFTFIAMGN